MPYRRLGSTDRLSTAVRDSTGTLVDPGDIFLDLLDPANVETTKDYPGDIVRDSTGLFHYDVANLSTLGLYGWLYRTTGNAQGIGDPRYFKLVSKWTPILLTLAEAKSFTNTTAPDADIELFIDSTTEFMEKKIGPIVPRIVTRMAGVTSSGLLLPTHIVPGSITAATQNGVAVSVTGWTASEEAMGLVTLPTSTYLYGTVTVTYTAGFNPIPTPLKEAAGKRMEQAYDWQRGGSGGYRVGGADFESAEGTSTFVKLLDAQRLEEPYTFPAVA